MTKPNDPPKPSPQASPPTSQAAASSAVATQGRRRLTYGLNVAVATAAALVIVILINVISYRFFYRADLTAMGSYSLSPQSRKLLQSVEKDFRLITLMREPDPHQFPERAAAVRQVRDLVNEYARQSDRVTAEHLDLGRDITRLQRFYESLGARYATKLEPLVAAVKRGQTAMENLHAEIPAQLEVLRALLSEPSLEDDQLRQFTSLVAQSLARYDQQYDRIQQQINQMLDDALPDYTIARRTVRDALTQMRDNVISRAIDQFRASANRAATPNAVKEKLLQVNQLLQRSLDAMQDGIRGLEAVEPVEEYDQVRNLLFDQINEDNVAVVGPDRVLVVSLMEMFREPDPTVAARGETGELRFLGEERITGALISMSLEQPPMIVFVSTGRQPALGPRGAYEHVAQRLRNVNFDVREWNPVGQMSAMGQPLPPGPPPQPASDQKAVWVVLPFEPVNPMNPMGAGGKEQAIELIEARLDVGDSAMVMIAVDVGVRFGAANPITDVLEPWGITPQVDRIVLREVMVADRQTRPTGEFIVDRWTADLPVTTALAGMQAYFVQTCPLLLGAAQSEGVTRYPLVRVRGQRMWAATDLNPQQLPSFDAATAADEFLVAAAAEREDSRLVVVADPLWASDQITLMSNIGMAGEDAVNVFGARFPGNAELFINSVYWLAGLEDLIAASPRTQDIRRVEAISPEVYTALRVSLLAGIPLLTFLAGIGVWLVRRRA